MGDYAKVPQRKFFFTSDDEAFEIMEKKIDAEINGFFKEFIRNLSTSMRKLEQ
jgi:molybdopterin biosynthesis enzyme MoaB